MTPTTATKKIQRTVFDLASFDDVKLVKSIPVPAKPTTLEEALAAVGNDSAKLLDVIHNGLVEAAVESARADISGFVIDDPDNEGEPVPYTGAYANEEKVDKINKAVLALAKLNGFEKSLDPEKKRELKEAAREFLRSNPAMLASIQG